ncbi:unnamed protein product [Angiostrongylus costaricensis]|uniref:Heparan-sulfate 6-O-sulfotransferase n=1 Tax=Angiostrongylus costaricensis TaxID=334426 RepID=A0A0R3PQK1_ANGCS|nr:unnamed protein product [Angiostrongylus costaricensis]
MLLSRFHEAKQVGTLYHFLNFLLSVAFLCAKGIPQICPWIFTGDKECGIDPREREILVFLAVIIAWKGRKATNWLHYINNIFLFSKIANIALFFRADALTGILYLMAVVVVTILAPEPVYSGPEKITYFQGSELFQELDRDRKFNLPNLRFGKLDVGRWPKEADRFRVNAHPTSRQLPTICVFKDAKELKRRPLVSEKRRAIPFVFTQENCILDFDLLNIYNECLERLSTKDRRENNDDRKTR